MQSLFGDEYLCKFMLMLLLFKLTVIFGMKNSFVFKVLLSCDDLLSEQLSYIINPHLSMMGQFHA